MIKHASYSRSDDNRRLVTVVFQPESPDTYSPTLEAVFEFLPPQDFSLTSYYPGMLIWLSTTRRDTKEPVTLSREEQQEVIQLAMEHAYTLNIE